MVGGFAQSKMGAATETEMKEMKARGYSIARRISLRVTIAKVVALSEVP